MSIELKILAFAALLQVVQFLAMNIATYLDGGAPMGIGSRDISKLGKPMVELLSDKPARLHRALSNMYEALVLFTIAVVVVILSGKSNGFTVACAWIFLGARFAFVPAYYFGMVPGRSIVWFAGFIPTIAMIVYALM